MHCLNSALHGPLEFTATDAVRNAIASAGRTEDVKFSPDGRRLAVARFNDDRCLLVDVDIDVASGRSCIRLRNLTEIASPDIRKPHGLAFLDSVTLIVANREGSLKIFRLPPRGPRPGSMTLHAEAMDGEAAFEKENTPGSVAVSPLGGDRYDILACNNYADNVTLHRLAGGERMKVVRNKVLLERGLNLPDGVAVSPDGRWIAISNHNTGSVLMYRNNPRLDRASDPTGSLVGAGYPHGIRFTSDGQFVFVADAGAPVVHVFFAIGGGWRGTREPMASLRVLDEAAFLRGRTNPQEGGPKGIDIDAGMRVLAMTCEERPLAFFDLRSMLRSIEHRSA